MLQMKRYDIGAGLIGGLLTVLLFGISYAMEPRWMLHPLVYWGSTLFYLAAMLGACLLVKRENEGLLGIREGLRTGCVTFLISNCFLATPGAPLEVLCSRESWRWRASRMPEGVTLGWGLR